MLPLGWFVIAGRGLVSAPVALRFDVGLKAGRGHWISYWPVLGDLHDIWRGSEGAWETWSDFPCVRVFPYEFHCTSTVFLTSHEQNFSPDTLVSPDDARMLCSND
jgi:hypothetical protein